jgi:hypothetical protein
MAERDPRHDDVVEFDFGDSAPKGTPVDPADDPFAALAGELSTSLEQDEARRRRLAADEQRRLAAERTGALENAAVDADQLEIDLRADLLAGDTATEAGPRFVDVRVGGRAGRRTGPGPLRRIASLVGTLLSTGPDQSKLPRVVAGYAMRVLAGAGLVFLIVTAAHPDPGSAFDLSYAPEKALVRHSAGLVAKPLDSAGDDAVGMLACDAATGLALQEKSRDLLDRFDAAAASGDTASLIAAFATPEAAAAWVDDAVALHAAGARRAYENNDPRVVPGMCVDTGASSDGLVLRFGGFRRFDLGARDVVLAEKSFLGIAFSYIRRSAGWELDSAVFIER